MITGCPLVTDSEVKRNFLTLEAWPFMVSLKKLNFNTSHKNARGSAGHHDQDEYLLDLGYSDTTTLWIFHRSTRDL